MLFPLSYSQRNIWDVERSIPGTSINSISTTIRISGRVDFALMQQALNLVTEHDMSLRTRLVMQPDGMPLQYHAPYEPEEFPLLDFTLTDEQGISHWETTLTREPIPLLEAPLYRFCMFRINENTAGILVKVHHIISDGWSQAMLCNRIGQTYLNLLAGQPHGLAQSPDYRLHLEEEQQYLASRALQADEAYWRGALAQGCEPAALKTVKSVVMSPVGRRRSYQLPQLLNHAIYSYCIANRVAPFAVLYMALAIYLQRMGSAGRFIIGVPIFNRTNYTFKQTTGMFVSTLPFVGQTDDSLTFDQFNEQLAENWLEMLRHQRLPFERIAALAPAQGPLFHIVLSYQDSKILESQDATVTFSGRWHYGGYQAEHLCIHLTNLEDNRKYSLDYDYLTQVFSDQEIDSFHHSLCNILTQALASPGVPIHALPLLDTAEQERLLYTFNNTARPLYEAGLYTLLRRRAEEHPYRAAVIWRGQRTSYAGLLEQAGNTAAALPAPGSLVALMMARTPALYSAMAGVMQAGCAWVVLPPALPRGRVEEILTQSGCAMILADSGTIGLAKEFGLPAADVNALPSAAPRAADVSPDDLAYVVYTSGSTGTPKGVEISQRNLANFARAMEGVYAKGAVLSLSNTAFDAFVIESAAALLCGRTVVLPQDSELEQPAALAELIRSYAVGFLSMTPSRLSALLRDGAFRAAMKNIERVICGGEAFPADLLDRLQLCTGALIYNQYGPSETTVGVSLSLLNDAGQITAGHPMENCRLYVLDGHLHPLPVGAVGDLYVGGLCVGRGYRGAPELTAASFLPSPFETGDTLYRTGDLASWTPEGEIVLAGRRDSQVKLRGLRIEPQEISARLARFPGVTAAAVKVCRCGGQDLLVGYYSAPAPLEESELLSFLGSYLPYYMVPARVLYLPQLPLGTTGKVDEKRLPAPPAEEAPQGPATGLEKTILDIFRTVLENAGLNSGSDYFLCGGNSLNAMETVGLLEQRAGVRLRISDLYVCRTPHRLARLLSGESAETPSAPRQMLAPAPLRDEYPLSPMQQGIYFQSRLDPTGLAYNMPGVFVLPAGTDLPRLTRALEQLPGLDDSFRMGFEPRGGSVAALPHPTVRLKVEQLSAASLEEACRAFVRPFDLAKPPLLRAALWRRPRDSRDILLLDSHHIVGDGLSTPVLLARLDDLYQGRRPQVPLTYKDYAWAQAQREEDHASYEFWQEQLLPLPEPLDLPTDQPRPREFDFRGEVYSRALDPRLGEALDAYCRTGGLTPFMVFFAAYGLLLCRLAGRQRAVIGTPVASRLRPELQQVCGPFLNTLPLPVGCAGTIGECLAGVQHASAAMLDHQEVSLEGLLNHLKLPRSLTGNPLYQVLFSMRPLDAAAFTLGGAPLECLPAPTGTAKLELSLEVSKTDGRYALNFEYASSLYARATVECMARSLETLLYSILDAAPGQPALALEATSPRDRLALWDKPNRLRVPYLDLPVHRLIEEQALLQPQGTAVVWHGQATTFAQLDRRACRLASLLRAQGIARGDRVGLCCARSPEMLACQLAILKAGAAYVPFLPSYPAQRVAYMMETAGARAALCDPAAAGTFGSALSCPVLRTDTAGGEDTFADEPVDGSDPIYVLFTSGSTGKPKGVQVPHRAIANLLQSMKGLMEGCRGPMLCSTNITFDIYTTESLLTLAQGYGVVLADEEEMVLPWRLAQLIGQTGADMAQFTPSRLQLCLNNSAFAQAAGRVEFVILVGEAVSSGLVELWHSHSSGRFVNMYGPTEAAVYVTAGDLLPGQPVTIGKPLGNCRIYVLDEQRRPLPPTGRGELYLAGECLADGYISRPDLTEKVFVDDPFFAGQRMYRTGDLGRLRADGVLECFGRCDSQIKLNGNRVELDEVNGALTACGAALAATVPVVHPDGSTSLCGFVTPAGLQIAELKAQLSRLLPPYMIPERIVALEALPSNASGKIDLPALKRLAQQDAPAARQNPAEAAAQTAFSAVPQPQEPPAPSAPAPQAAETRTDAPPKDVSLLTAVQTALPAGPQPQQPAPPAPAEQAAAARADAPREDVSAPTAVQAVLPTEPKPAEQPAAPAPKTPQPAAAGTGEAALKEVWRQVLGTAAPLDADRSFFEQGGSSLAALNVLSLYFNRGITMTLAEFYEHPTLRQQAALLGCQTGSPQAAAQPAAASAPAAAAPAQPALQAAEPDRYPAKVPQYPRGPHAPRRHPLLTGATGFLGAHLLRALLEQGAEEVTCLVRGDPQRLYDALAWYFGRGWVQNHLGSIRTVQGDLCRDGLGLEDAVRSGLQNRTDIVYHTAADVRHYGSYDDFYQINTLGTARMVRFCLEGGLPLRHVSTASISGDRLTACPGQNALFCETDFDIGQNWRDNVYLKTKFLAEWQVYQAMEQGLDARVFRVGRLVGRSSDGVFQRDPGNNAFRGMLMGLAAVKAVPALLARMPVELTPVDLCARSILALEDAPLTAWHITQADPQPLGQLAAQLFPGIPTVDDSEFDRLLAAQSGSAAALVEQWNSLKQFIPRITVSNAETHRFLAMANQQWPHFSAAAVLCALLSGPAEKGE